MSAIDDLRTQVANTESTMASAVTFIEGLKTRIDAALADDDLDAIEDISRDLGEKTTALAAAIATNPTTGNTSPNETTSGQGAAQAQAPVVGTDPNPTGGSTS